MDDAQLMPLLLVGGSLAIAAALHLAVRWGLLVLVAPGEAADEFVRPVSASGTDQAGSPGSPAQAVSEEDARAIASLTERIAAARAVGDWDATFAAMFDLAGLYMAVGQEEQSMALVVEARDLARKVGDRETEAGAEAILAAAPGG